MSTLNEAMQNVTAINELIEKTSDTEKMGLSIEAGDLLFDVLMVALGKAERVRTAAMIEERKSRNKATHTAIDLEA